MPVDTAARPELRCGSEPSARRRALPDWVDRIRGSDPGLIRLLMASQAVATIAVAMLAEWLFVRLTHALQIDTHGAVLPPAQAAAVTAQHHGVLVVAILLGAILGTVATFCAAMFATPRAQLEGFTLMPVPMVAGLALGLVLAPYRALSLASFVAVLAAGAYARRFGPRGFVYGLVLFLGDFLGFFLHAQFQLADLGWLTAEIAIGALVTIIAHFSLFYPSRRAALRRMQRSYRVRAREVAKAALDLMEGPANGPRASRRLHRRLIRLNETALMIDAQLGHPGALSAGQSATTLHQRLFESELALTNMSRFAERLAGLEFPAEIRNLATDAVAAVSEIDVLRAEFAGHQLLARLRGQGNGPDLDQDTHIVLHRFAGSVLDFTKATQSWRADHSGTAATEEVADSFTPAVPLVGGWLPGSAIVSAAASVETGRPTREPRDRLWEHVKLAPHSRIAIQMTVAVTAALLLGDLVSGRRFYWAVLAAFVTFMGANNAGEQLRKGFFRVGGTVVGVLLGAVGAHLVGNRTDIGIAVILVSLFFGLYFMRISYAFMVIGVTITVSQLYLQLDEFTNSLLVLRLEETALGAAVAALTVLCVFPLHTRRVARLAARHYLQALADVVTRCVQRLAGAESKVELQAAIRRLDGCYQALVTTMRPVGIPFIATADSPHGRLLETTAASRHYARNLLIDTTADIELTAEVREQLNAAGRQLADSLGELIAHLQHSDTTPRSYVRTASLFDRVSALLDSGDYLAPRELALRDLQLLDGTMATLAQSLGLTVRALDTDQKAEHL
jgi:hypothetical protein